jgi:hypothetical protein
MAAITSMVITAASVYYSYTKSQEAQKAARQAQRAAEASADAAKGTSVAVSNQSANLPVIYGRAFHAGVQVYVNTKNSVELRAPATGGVDLIGSTPSLAMSYVVHHPAISAFGADLPAYDENLTRTSISGSKNEFLFLEQAICHAPISRVIGCRIDDREATSKDLQYGQLIRAYTIPAVDPMMKANFEDRGDTAKYTNTAHAAMCFKLNRDEPQYSGIPNVSFYIEGMLVKDIVRDVDGYSLSSTRVYSNNPALCLLDYLTNTVYGRGLDVSKIDLGSFARSKAICDIVVKTDVVASEYYKLRDNVVMSSVQRKLFECNVVLSTDKTIRDNITILLDTMHNAYLTWSAGKYKLQLQYPSNLGEISVVDEITDDDIVIDSVSVQYPSAGDRINYYKATFSDEALGFKDNTAVWPPKGSAVYKAYLAEDNFLPLEKAESLIGICDYTHAVAKAEELVRASRAKVVFSFSLRYTSIFYEPGDIILVTSEILNIAGEYLQVSEIEAKDDGTARITCLRYDPAQLAWNAPDDQIIPNRISYNDVLDAPVNLTISYSTELSSMNVGNLNWESTDTLIPYAYIIEIFQNGVWILIGETSATTVALNSLKAGSYIFSVRAKSRFGRLSERSTATLTLSDGTETPPTFTFSERLVKTSQTITTELDIKAVTPAITGYLSHYYAEISTDNISWSSLGNSFDGNFTKANLPDSIVASVRMCVVNRAGDRSAFNTTSHTIVGKTAPPANVTNFTASHDAISVYLAWSDVPDIDLSHYELYYSSSNVFLARVTGTTHRVMSLTVGTMEFSIKAVDTGGRLSPEFTKTSIEIGRPIARNVTGAIHDENYVLEWPAFSSFFSIDHYTIRIVANGVTEATLQVKATSFRSKVNWIGSKTFYVSATDINGLTSDEDSVELSVMLSAPAFTKREVIDNNVLLYWRAPLNNTLPISVYRISKGSTYETSQLVGDINSQFTVLFERESGDFTYWIAAIDTAGNISTVDQITAKVSQPPDYVFVTDYSSDFNGTKVNAVKDVNAKLIFSFDDNATWDEHFAKNGWTDTNDVGNNLYLYPSNTTGSYTEIYDYGTTISAMMAQVTYSGRQITGSTKLSVQIGVCATIDGTYIMSDLSSIYGTAFRYIKVIVTANGSTSSLYQMDSLNIRLDAKSITETGRINCLATDTDGTLVTFQKRFIDIESINVTPLNSSFVATVPDFVDVPNPTFFRIRCFDSNGNRITSNVSYTIQGK